MEENQVGGMLKSAAGKFQEAAEAFTGDAVTELRGKARQVVGQAQARYGDAVEAMRSTTKEQPLIALLAAGCIGFLLGALIRRH